MFADLLKFGIGRNGEFATSELPSKLVYLREGLHLLYQNALFSLFKFPYYLFSFEELIYGKVIGIYILIRFYEYSILL